MNVYFVFIVAIEGTYTLPEVTKINFFLSVSRYTTSQKFGHTHRTDNVFGNIRRFKKRNVYTILNFS